MICAIQDVLFVATALLLFCYILSWWRNRRSCAGYPPGPLSFPLVGNLPQLGPTPNVSLTKMAAKYGAIFQIKLGSWPAVVINSGHVVREAFLKNREDFAARPPFDSFGSMRKGRGVSFGVYDDAWRKQKQLCTTALRQFMQTPSSIDSLENAILRETDITVEEFLAIGGKPFCPKRCIELIGASVVYGLCFGLERETRKDKAYSSFVACMDTFNEFQAAGGNLSDIMPWTKPFLKKSVRKFIQIISTLESFVGDKYEHHRMRNDNVYENCIMDHLIKGSRSMRSEELARFDLTEEHIARSCEEMVGAGVQTTVAIMKWIFLYLAFHQKVQEKIREEIVANVGEGVPSGRHRKQMPYTEAFILETIRYSAALPFLLPHSCVQDTKLCGYKIDKGTVVMVNSFALSRDPDVWKEPDEFKPERFLSENGTTLDVAQVNDFIPFGAGKRRCIGERFAKLELFLVTTRLVQKCRISPPDGVQLSLGGKFGLSIDPLPYKVVVTKSQ